MPALIIVAVFVVLLIVGALIGLVGLLASLVWRSVFFIRGRVRQGGRAMCIDDPLQHHDGRLHRLFDTPPPIVERIVALEQVSYTRAA